MASSDCSARIRQKCIGAGKIAIEDQEIGDLRGRDAAVRLAVHFQRADAFQQRGPLIGVERRADVGHAGQQQVILDVEDPRGLVGPFEKPGQAAEMPGLAARHGRFGQALEQRSAEFQPVEELKRRFVFVASRATRTIR